MLRRQYLGMPRVQASARMASSMLRTPVCPNVETRRPLPEGQSHRRRPLPSARNPSSGRSRRRTSRAVTTTMPRWHHPGSGSRRSRRRSGPIRMAPPDPWGLLRLRRCHPPMAYVPSRQPTSRGVSTSSGRSSRARIPAKHSSTQMDSRRPPSRRPRRPRGLPCLMRRAPASVHHSAMHRRNRRRRRPRLPPGSRAALAVGTDVSISSSASPRKASASSACLLGQPGARSEMAASPRFSKAGARSRRTRS